MPKYMITGSYTVDGRRGLMKEGGSGRRKAVEEALQSLGGRLESIYFTFGDADVVVIGEFPNNVSAVAAALVASVSGTVTIKTTVLITPEEMDEATRMTVRFRPAGT
jgi:uncharacterized protein with GYD domain